MNVNNIRLQNSPEVITSGIAQEDAKVSKETLASSEVPAAETQKNGESSTISQLPTLPESHVASSLLEIGYVPSLSALALTQIQDFTDKQRQANTLARAAESQNIVQQIQEEAETMRSQALSNLVLGLTAAGVQLVGAAAALKTQAGGISRMAATGDKVFLETANATAQLQNSAINALSSVASTVKETISTTLDARIKEQEASVEMRRAYLSQLDSLNDALKSVIQKSQSSAESILQTDRETQRTIIRG